MSPARIELIRVIIDRFLEKKKMTSTSTDNLTGSLISLITNALVRYEGTLVEINRAERSMNLENVRSFGTEGRRDGKNEI